MSSERWAVVDRFFSYGLTRIHADGEMGEGGLGFVAYVLSVAATDRRGFFDRINRIGRIGKGRREDWLATKGTKEHKRFGLVLCVMCFLWPGWQEQPNNPAKSC